MEFEVRGFEEIKQGLQNVIKTLAPEKIEALELDAARLISQEMKSQAPKGPTGKLKRSPVAKLLKRTNSLEAAPAIAALDRRKAPHAHLVIKGTKPRQQKTTGRYTGVMPANDFVTTSYQSKKDAAEQQIINRLMSDIEGAW